VLRKVKKIVRGEDKIDGAGVELTRVIGKPDVYDFDPFLMLDAFDHDDPASYIKGFPWHPHRGIETVTYLLEGEIRHGDSLGNSGVIYDGDCQWMTAGSGIIHQEMPQARPKMLGVQLWINLPAKHKMTAPRYRDFTKKDIPGIEDGDSMVYLVAGEHKGHSGPMEEITVRPTYMDVRVIPDGRFSFETDPQNTLFIYILKGSALTGMEGDQPISARQAVLFDKGDQLELKAGDQGLNFLLFAGKPLNEEIAWGGPIVMNTKDQLDLAFREIDEGTFIKEHHMDGSFSSSSVHQEFYRQ
jgi:quercetin 2,3-dioxygenase